MVELDPLPPVETVSNYEFLGPVLPVRVHDKKGDVVIKGTPGQSDFSITLTSDGKENLEETYVVLDYGWNVSGIPIFNVIQLELNQGNEPVELLVAYSEGRDPVYLLDGDGPFPFTSGANTLRAVPYKIGVEGRVEDFLMMGGQRWQCVRLRSAGRITLTEIGFRPTAYHYKIENLPGYFRCSDEFLNKIWDAGTWTGLINQIPARVNTPSFTPTFLGTLVDSQRPSQFYRGSHLTDYRMICQAKILQGGLMFSVRNTTGFGLQIQFIISPDHSLTTVKVWWGMYDVDQITLYPIELGRTTLSKERGLILDKWYTFGVKVVGHNDLEIEVDGTIVARLPQGHGLGKQPDGLDRDIETPKGSFGFGCGKHQQALFKNIAAYEEPSGILLYSNSLQSNSVLSDFCVGTNPVSVVYDGAKRDRAVWLGDTITQSMVLFVTTGQVEFMEGSIDSVLSRQNDKGFVPIYTLPGLPMYNREPSTEPPNIFEWLAGSFGAYVVRVVWEYWWYTGDKVALKRWYPAVQNIIKNLQSYTDGKGLLQFKGNMGEDSGKFLLQFTYYYNTPREGASIKQNSLFIIALDRASQMAASLGHSDESEAYTALKGPIIEACNKYLFNEEMGFYDASESMRGELSEDGNAFAIQAGIPSPERTVLILKTLRKLYTPNGVLSFPLGSKAMNKQAVVSPIMNSWHAQGCIETPGFGSDAREIIKRCWGPMVDESSPWYTRSFWEFSTPEGTPFMDKFCSLAHPFSSLPVQQLSAYMLGARATSPGWDTFIVSPVLDFCKGVDWAQGRVPTPHGILEVHWQKDGSKFKISISAPKGITGKLTLFAEDGKRIELDGTPEFGLVGGKSYVLDVNLS